MQHFTVSSLWHILFGGEFSLFKIIIWVSILLLFIVKFLAYKFLNINISKIDMMSGEEFEVYVAKLLQKHGFKNVSLTGGSGDFGVDILAEFKKNTYAIQVKRYKSFVGLAAVQEAFSGAKYYETHAAIVITNSYFTDAARKLAVSCDVILINRNAFLANSFVEYLK